LFATRRALRNRLSPIGCARSGDFRTLRLLRRRSDAYPRFACRGF
jgi:hypothetical protein